MTRSRRSLIPPRRSPCPVAACLDLLGDRWTLLVVRDLFSGKHRYGEFAESMEGIPTNILAGMFGFHPAEFFQLDAAEAAAVRQAPKVKF